MGVSLAYSEYGTGSPLVVAHGLLGSRRNWRRIAQALSDRFRVFTVDMRNHGDSPSTNRLDYHQLAEDLRDFLLVRGIAPAAVLGHSMGGKAAMVLALQWPEVVSRLVVADIVPVSVPDELSPYVEAMQRVNFESVSRRSDADGQLAEWIPEAGVRAFLLQNLEATGDRFDWQVNLSAVAASVPALLDFPQVSSRREYAARTLFIRGDASSFVRDEHLGRIRELFPNVTVRTLRNAGHWLHVDQPDAFTETVRAFLADSASSAESAYTPGACEAVR